MAHAGCFAIVLEGVPSPVAVLVTEAVNVPTIGIGAGPDTDGQILVLYDVLDIAPGKRTRFSKNYMAQEGSIHGAIEIYIREIKSQEFPTAEYAFQ